MAGGRALATVGNDVDSMYPTWNTPWTCADATVQIAYCRTDNATLTFGAEGSLTSAQKTVIRNMINGQFGPTDFVVSEQSPIVYTGTAETDVVYQAIDLGSSLYGMTYCDDAVSTGVCDQHYVLITPTRITSSASTPCHETGHAVGLTHGENAYPAVANDDPDLACLMTPGTNVTSIGGHNTYEINITY